MRKNFKIIFYSKVRFLVLFLLFIISLIPISLLFLPLGIGGQISIGVYLIVSTILSFFTLPKYFAKKTLQITLDPKGFQLDWIKPYWGSKPRQSQYIGLDELKSYKYEPSYNFSTLRLKLKSGEKLKLHRWYNDDKDDFDKFMAHFRRIVENHNKRKSTTTLIEKERQTMENRVFLLAAGIIIALIFLATELLIIFKGMSNLKGLISIAIVLGPLIWVTRQIIQGLKKK